MLIETGTSLIRRLHSYCWNTSLSVLQEILYHLNFVIARLPFRLNKRNNDNILEMSL